MNRNSVPGAALQLLDSFVRNSYSVQYTLYTQCTHHYLFELCDLCENSHFISRYKLRFSQSVWIFSELALDMTHFHLQRCITSFDCFVTEHFPFHINTYTHSFIFNLYHVIVSSQNASTLMNTHSHIQRRKIIIFSRTAFLPLFLYGSAQFSMFYCHFFLLIFEMHGFFSEFLQ